MAAPWIAVVDDDPSVLKALKRLLRIRSFGAKTYGSAFEFLATLPGETPDCLIADLRMPGMSGLQLHQFLTGRRIESPPSSKPHTITATHANAASSLALLTICLSRSKKRPCSRPSQRRRAGAIELERRQRATYGSRFGRVAVSMAATNTAPENGLRK